VSRDVSAILVTGGTGTLGRVVVDDLLAESQSVTVLSRRPAPATASATRWAVGDLRSGDGIDAAVAGNETIIHCASQRGDVGSARRLVEAARRAGCSHLVYISIVGVDEVPIGYYRSKLEVEHLIEGSGLPFTILRTTQFHNLIVRALEALSRVPVMPVPSHTSFQPIDVREVATRLIELSGGAPAGRVTDMGGPEVLGVQDLARRYLSARARRRLVVPVWLPGRGFAGFRHGGNLTPEHATGRFSFDQFLEERYSVA
jgi:uncharacterized protein YbjT (DUF2867 family)